jgi:hypothetical protein
MVLISMNLLWYDACSYFILYIEYIEYIVINGWIYMKYIFVVVDGDI